MLSRAFSHRRLSLLGVVVLAAAVGGGATAVTQGAGSDGQAPPSAAPSVSSASTAPGGKVAVTGPPTIKLVASPDNSTVGSGTTPSLLPGMTTSITVPEGQRALVIARFSAESACYGGDAESPEWCIATMKVGNANMLPDTGSDFAFDSTDNGSRTSFSWQSHAMERYRTVSAGTYNVKVLASTTQFGSAPPTFWTGERELTVEVWPIA